MKTDKFKIPAKFKGIACIVTSAFCFTFMNAFVRLSGELPTVQKTFFRNFVALIFAFIILKKQHSSLLPSDRKNTIGLILRSVCGVIGMLCNFYAVDNLNLSDASMLNKLSPFFVIIFSFIFLKEKINTIQVAAVVAAFIGCLFIIKPTFANSELFPSVIGFIGGIGAGAAYTAVRYLGLKGEKGTYIVFFFSSFSAIVTVPFLIFDYHPMTLYQLAMLLLAGLSAAGGQFAITAAYRYAPAKEISVYDYSQVVFSAILGFFLFSQLPDIYSFIGYIIICAVAVMMFVYNNKNAKK